MEEDKILQKLKDECETELDWQKEKHIPNKIEKGGESK